MPSISTLAQGTPSADAWRAVTTQLNGLSGPALEAAVEAFESNSAHWPTRLDPWQGYSADEGVELRRSPQDWVREIYTGLHSPKHRLCRIVDSPLRLRKGQALENALSPDAQLPNVRQIAFDQSKVDTSNVKFEEAATSAQQDAQSALNQDQVPRAYQNTVRAYFDDLKK